MNLSESERNFLALHYLFPVPKNRLNGLLEFDPNLEEFHTYSAERLAFLLKIKSDKAVYLKENYYKTRMTPYEELYKQHRITPIPFTHSLYPKQLLELIDPPTVLYTKGDTTILNETFKVAIIGSRKASSYSKSVMSLIVPPLVAHDTVIISGLAKGADAMAHRAAIFYGGKTIAVLGHGLFHLYPAENKELAREISENHLLVSEYPPYVKPERWTFPMRNRIISGLSDAVIVTESASKSGTMSTVEHALDHGKHIFAVPGSVTSSLSEGPNKLIDEGAQPLWNGFQVVGSLLKQT